MPSSSPDSNRLSSDLRHMSSNNVLVSPTRDGHRSPNRISQNPHRLGSRSPSSIPSSPTSIHSSSSAIFERDIEPISAQSPTQHHPNPHRIPRAKGTEALEQAVPSVLDSAAAVLGSLQGVDVAEQVAVVAPASSSSFDTIGRARSSGLASPIGSYRSRSPSPLGSRGTSSAHTRATDLLFSIPAPITSPTSVLGLHNPNVVSSSPPRPGIQSSVTSTTVTQASSTSSNFIHLANSQASPPVITTNPDYPSTISSVDPATYEDPSPLTTTQEHPPTPTFNSSPSLSPLYPSIPLVSVPTSPIAAPPSIASNNVSQSHPPSPLHVPKKRLSFMSYSDLLSSTPQATQTLSSLTTCASSSEPPPHIPSVSGLNIASAIQAQAQQQGPSHFQQSFAIGGGGHNYTYQPASQGNSKTPSLHAFSLVPTGGVTHAGKRDSIAMLDNIGGEWEKEGLGRGLEERLDALVIPPAAGGLPPVLSGGSVHGKAVA